MFKMNGVKRERRVQMAGEVKYFITYKTYRDSLDSCGQRGLQFLLIVANFISVSLFFFFFLLYKLTRVCIFYVRRLCLSCVIHVFFCAPCRMDSPKPEEFSIIYILFENKCFWYTVRKVFYFKLYFY